jgi:hypothetical protein
MGHRSTVIARAAICGFLVSVAVGAPPPAAAGWLRAHTFASNDAFHDEQSGDVAANATGEDLVAWHFFDGFSDSVHVARRLGPHGDWEPSQQLSSAFSSARYPRVALDDAGNAVVVWTLTYSEQDEVVQASIRLGPNGVWSPPVQVSPAGEWSELGEVGFDNEGNLTAVWANITHHVVQSRVYRTSTQTWSETQTISTGEMRSGPRLAVAPGGRAVVAWSTPIGNGNVILRAAIRPSRTGAWLSEHDLSSATGYASVNDIAVHPSGQTIVAWDRLLGSDYLEVATLPAGSEQWGQPDRLNAPGTNGQNGQVAIDRNGNAFAAWRRDIELNQDGIDVAYRPAGGTAWSPAQAVAEHVTGPSLTVDDAGDAIVVYGEVNWFVTIRSRVRYARSGVWSPPVDLSQTVDMAYPYFSEPEPTSGAIALWQLYSNECDCFTLQGAQYISRPRMTNRASAASPWPR